MGTQAGRGKVLLAFSGGIDSSYCVGKLRKAGYHVEGLILDMTGDGEFIGGALTRASTLGLECEVLDIRKEFEGKIIEYFTREYLHGRTPAPCTLCNPLIKWHFLYQKAKQKGFDHIATGHYFRKTEVDGYTYVRKALDNTKDQSYYLWMLPQQILSMALTPMGDEIKKEVAAAEPRKESMGVCFLKGEDYRDFIRSRAGCHPSCQPGKIKSADGTFMGKHDGVAFYTIGQKKGLGLPAGYAVTGIDPRDNTLISDTNERLFYRHIILENYKLAPGHSSKELQLVIRGYGVNPDGDCSITEEAGKLKVSLVNPAWAPAKGQPAVLYSGELVMGGGFICEYW